MKIALFVILLSIIKIQLQAQNWTTSSRSAALGNTALSDSTEWNVLQNPSCPANKNTSQNFIGITDRRLYNIKEYHSHHTLALFRIKKLNTGLSLQKEGYSQFKQTQIGAHISHQINNYKLGASIYYQEFLIGETEKTAQLSISLGGSIRINKDLIFGCSIQNIAIKKETQWLLASGLSYYLSNKVSLFVDFKNSLQNRFNIHLGIEYKIFKYLYVLAGYNRQVNSFSFGSQFKIKYFECNYTFLWGSRFGNTHQLSCSIRWNTKK
jgi:hypothetical protein